MQRSHKIRLDPNNVQKTYFAKACGCSRLAYNVGLAKWKELYEAGEKPSGRSVKAWFNLIKDEQFPFVREVTKCATERSFDDLNSAFQRFFKKKAKYPKFKKKGLHDSFYISNQYFRVEGKYIVIPKLGKVRMTEELRFEGKILSATVSYRAGLWFVSIAVEIPDKPPIENQDRKFVGIDMGLEKFATTSDGWYYENPRIYRRFEKHLRRLNKDLSRKQKGSKNWHKAKLRLSKLHYRIACTRNDFTHKFTTEVSRDYSDVCLEDLNVRGMMSNRKLAKSIASVAWYETRRQFEYKSTVHYYPRFKASSCVCCECGMRHDLKLSDRWLSCSCGNEIDRDHNAAINIKIGGASADSMPVETKALAVSEWVP